jgi:hypothetical protein
MEAGDGISGDYDGFSVQFSFFLTLSQWINGQLPRSGGRRNYMPSLTLGIFERICH